MMALEVSSLPQPKVTIMIPTYRQRDLVGDAIVSALAQDYANLEVIVADDASPDDTEGVVARFGDSRLRYHRNAENLGRVGNYRQALYALASGDWVINLDGDDYFTDPGFISAAMAEAACDPAAVMVVARRRVQSAGKTVDVTLLPPVQSLSGIDLVLQLPARAVHLPHMATLYRRDLAVHLDFYRTDLISADWESLYRLAVLGRVIFLDRVIGNWRLGAGNATQSCDWCGRLDNLRIWDSIFDAALAAGASPLRTSVARLATRVAFARFGLMSVLQTGGVSSGVDYLKALWRSDYRLASRTVLNVRALLALCRAALRRAEMGRQ